MTASMYEPRYWNFRSEEIRALASGFNDEHAKQIMLRISAEYDGLAELVRTLPRPDEK